MLQLREVKAELRDARDTAGPTIERLVRSAGWCNRTEAHQVCRCPFVLVQGLSEPISAEQESSLSTGSPLVEVWSRDVQERELRECCEEGSQATANNAALKVR